MNKFDCVNSDDSISRTKLSEGTSHFEKSSFCKYFVCIGLLKIQSAENFAFWLLICLSNMQVEKESEWPGIFESTSKGSS